MSHMSAIQFPVFLLDLDNYMYLLDDQRSLHGLEEIDVVDGEYVGRWDITGKPLEIYWTKSGAILEPSNKIPELDLLLSAIVQYARLRAKKAVVPPQEISGNPVKLFVWADSL